MTCGHTNTDLIRSLTIEERNRRVSLLDRIAKCRNLCHNSHYEEKHRPFVDLNLECLSKKNSLKLVLQSSADLKKEDLASYPTPNQFIHFV